jgi:hypothetical protein
MRRSTLTGWESVFRRDAVNNFYDQVSRIIGIRHYGDVDFRA